MTESPEHTACRSTTPAERRGVEGRLGRWRVGESNPWNVYRGNRHAGVFFDAEHAGELQAALAALNGDPERDEQLRAEGRRQANNAIDWNTTCVGCAERLDGLYAERMAGYDEALRDVELALSDPAAAGDALRVVRRMLAQPAQQPADARSGLPGRAG